MPPPPHPSLTKVCLLTPQRLHAPPQLTAELVQAAGRRACHSALLELRPQIHYVLHADPLAAEPHDYADPNHVGQQARHCLDADDLLKLDDGRAASAAARWAAALSAGEVAPTCSPVAPRPRMP